MARPKLGDGETQRLHVKISDEELTTIDDWRYANRIPSRSEAVRRLVQIGLAHDAEFPELSDAMLEQVAAWQELEAAIIEYADIIQPDASTNNEIFVEKLFSSILRQRDAISHLVLVHGILGSKMEILYEETFDAPKMMQEALEKSEVFREWWRAHRDRMDGVDE